MTISDAQYAAWLDDPTAQRVTLYRIGCISGVPAAWVRAHFDRLPKIGETVGKK